MWVASQESWADFADSYHAGWTTIDAELTTSTYVIIYDEDDSICRICARAFSAGRCRDSIWSHHVDALPWANIYAPLTSDAL